MGNRSYDSPAVHQNYEEEKNSSEFCDIRVVQTELRRGECCGSPDQKGRRKPEIFERTRQSCDLQWVHQEFPWRLIFYWRYSLCPVHPIPEIPPTDHHQAKGRSSSLQEKGFPSVCLSRRSPPSLLPVPWNRVMVVPCCPQEVLVTPPALYVTPSNH